MRIKQKIKYEFEYKNNLVKWSIRYRKDDTIGYFKKIIKQKTLLVDGDKFRKKRKKNKFNRKEITKIIMK